MANTAKTLNEVFSSLSARRRYEVWFLRLGLADGNGAWWIRYLLMNPGRSGCSRDPQGLPVQVWATWFPAGGQPQTFIRGFPLDLLDLSPRGQSPFHLRVGDNEIGEDFCHGALDVDGHTISWDLGYTSSFHVTLSAKGWIGFSRTPHSDARFSGSITLDGRSFTGSPLGFGVQGHNCGYRHRKFWTWSHAYFAQNDGSASTLEALLYDMPLGLVFRKAVLWHGGKRYVIRALDDMRRNRKYLQWVFRGSTSGGIELQVALDGGGPGIHRVPYRKTDCSTSFEVVNNSLASAVLCLRAPGGHVEKLETHEGAVLEMASSD